MKQLSFSVGLVLFEPTIDEIKNINKYVYNFKKLYIYDNSEKNNLSTIKNNIAYTNYDYIYNGKNEGMSRALNNLLNLAHNDGFRYIMILDQDSVINSDDIIIMQNYIQNNKDSSVGIFSPHVCFNQSDIKKNNKFDMKYIDFAITSGCFFDVNIYLKLKGFDEKLFIDGVDREYCLKMKFSNYKICEVLNSILLQTLGYGKKNIFGVYEHSAIRNYYIFRNRLYIISKYSFYFKGMNRVRFLYLSIIKQVLSVLCCEHNKISKLKYMRKALKDFKNNEMGKIKY